MSHDHKAAVEFLRKYYSENSKDSVDDGTREAHKKHFHVNRALVKRVRREVIEAKPQTAEVKEPVLRIVPNDPIIETVPEEELCDTVIPTVTPAPPPPNKELSERDKIIAWAWKYAEENASTINPMLLTNACNRKWGRGIDVKTNIEICKTVKEVNGLPISKVEARIKAKERKEQLGAVTIRKREPAKPTLRAPVKPVTPTKVETATPACPPQEKTILTPLVGADILSAIAKFPSGWVISWSDGKMPKQWESVAPDKLVSRIAELRLKGIHKNSINVWMRAPFRID